MEGREEYPEQSPQCERCRKRTAVIYRRLTRQRLCLTCHLDYVTRTVRRNMGSLKNLGPGTHAFVPIVPWMEKESLLLLSIVAGIEKKHRSFAWAIIFNDAGEAYQVPGECRRLGDPSNATIGGWTREGVGGALIVSAPQLTRLLNVRVVGKIAAWRRIRAVTAEAVRRAGGGVVVLPTCMEALASLELSGYLRAVGFPLGEVRPSVDSDLVRGFVNGFYGIPCSETTLASILREGDPPAEVHCPSSGDPYDFIASRIVFDTVADQSFEVLFSMQKSSLALTRPGELARCRLCGGFSRRETCEWCGGIVGILGSLDVVACPWEKVQGVL